MDSWILGACHSHVNDWPPQLSLFRVPTTQEFLQEPRGQGLPQLLPFTAVIVIPAQVFAIIAIYTLSQAPAPWRSSPCLPMSPFSSCCWNCIGTQDLYPVYCSSDSSPSVCVHSSVSCPPAKPNEIQTPPLWSPMWKGVCLLWHFPRCPSFLSSRPFPEFQYHFQRHLYSTIPLLPKSTSYLLQAVLWNSNFFFKLGIYVRVIFNLPHKKEE